MNISIPGVVMAQLVLNAAIRLEAFQLPVCEIPPNHHHRASAAGQPLTRANFLCRPTGNALVGQFGNWLATNRCVSVFPDDCQKIADEVSVASKTSNSC